MNTAYVICDMQFGSCGKGLLAGYLAEKEKPDTVVAAWGPNAGHTYINARGRKMVNIAIPNGIVSPNLRCVLIGPGSVINPSILMKELDEYQDLLSNADVLIHENAAVVTEQHRELESTSTVKIGSTMKGVGEAVIQKIRRDPKNLNNAGVALRGTPLEGLICSVMEYNDALDGANKVQIEGAQGFSLSINQGFYPYTTSRDCTVHQILSDCAIPTMSLDCLAIYGVARTYPIRVANRYDYAGNMIGWSGPQYHDQCELQWKDIGILPELTTVTKLPRRIFSFSMEQIKQAARMNNPDGIFLNFCNYPGFVVEDLIRDIEKETGVPVVWTGWGPTFNDVKER